MWSKLDDGILDHPKIAKVGLLGFGWYVAGLIYCNRNLTDGFVPWNIARTLVPLEHVDPETGRVIEAAEACGMAGWSGAELGELLCARLCHAGLWHEVNGGYYVHDFLDWNPSKEKVLAEREAARERMKKRRSSEVPAKFGFPVPVPDPVPSINTEKQEGTTDDTGLPAATLPPLAMLWNEIVQDPKVLRVSGQRRIHAEARMQTYPDLAWWRTVLERLRDSPFLRGQNDRGWRADFDWLIRNDENPARVLEGKYDRATCTLRDRKAEIRRNLEAVS